MTPTDLILGMADVTFPTAEEEMHRGCIVSQVLSDSFTDHAEAACPSSLVLCESCTWAMTGKPPDTLRLWSIVYREDGHAFAPSHPVAPRLGPRVHLQNKADPSEFMRVLLYPPTGLWVCSVADSGQIHVAPFAHVNDGDRWCVRFERQNVRGDSATFPKHLRRCP